MHFYERNIVEIKNEYTLFLTNIMTPLLYEGIKLIYNEAIVMEKKFVESIKIDPNVKNPGVFKIFQIYLKDIPKLNNHSIEQEANRIINGTKCAEWFEDLVKAVVKSNIVLLTFNASEKKCKLINEKLHETIDIKTFIHKCYIECSRIFYNYPELFWHGFSTLDIKRNQREAHDLIKDAISEAIRKMLPIKLILEEYLSKDYIKDDNDISEHVSEAKFTNMNSLIKRDLYGRKDISGVSIMEESGMTSSNPEKSSSGKVKEKSPESHNSVFKLMDSDESDISDKIDDIEENIKSDKIDNLVLDKKETIINMSAGEQPQMNTEEQIKHLLTQPGYVAEPIKIKKSKNPLEEFGLPPDQPTPPALQQPEPKPAKDINIKIDNKIGQGDGFENQDEFFDSLMKK